MNELHIDKTHWKKYRFGDVAIQTKEVVDIENTDLTRYVAGEHMFSEDIHLRKWGTVGDGYLGPAFIRKFNKGDILYGSRRTYLKKVAIADFDGITANTTFVIKANEDLIEPVLLAHLMLSHDFTEYSVKNSRGSVNPYINWKDIADYEFHLPPKAEQKRLAELLWAADEVVEKEKRELERVEELYNYQIENLFVGEKVALGDCAYINEKTLGAKTPNDYKFHYIDIASIISPKHLGPLTEYTFADAPSRARRIVKQNDIVLSLVRPYLKSFVQVKSNQDNLIASTGTAVVSAKSQNSTDFIFHMLFSKAFMTFCENRMNGTNYPAITPADLADFQIPSYTYNEQLSIANKLNAIDNTIEQLEYQIIKSQKVKQEIISIIF